MPAINNRPVYVLVCFISFASFSSSGSTNNDARYSSSSVVGWVKREPTTKAMMELIPPNTAEFKYTGKFSTPSNSNNSVTSTPIVPAMILHSAPVLVTLFHRTLAKATGPHDAANKVAANTEIQKMAGGCHMVNSKVIQATKIIMYLLIFNSFSSEILAL